MAGACGHWLVYLRFDEGGVARVVHLFCDTPQQVGDLLSLLKAVPPDSGPALVEYATFFSSLNVRTAEAPEPAGQRVLTHADFIAKWWAASGRAPPGSSPLALMFDAPAPA